MNLHNLYLQEQHSELFKIWSGIIKVGNMAKSLLMKSSPGSYFKTNVIVCVYLCVRGSGVNLGNSYVRLSNHMTISHDHLTWPSHIPTLCYRTRVVAVRDNWVNQIMPNVFFKLLKRRPVHKDHCFVIHSVFISKVIVYINIVIIIYNKTVGDMWITVKYDHLC